MFDENSIKRFLKMMGVTEALISLDDGREIVMINSAKQEKKEDSNTIVNETKEEVKIEQENPVVEKAKQKRIIDKHSLYLDDPRFVCSVDLRKYLGLASGTLNYYCSKKNIESKRVGKYCYVNIPQLYNSRKSNEGDDTRGCTGHPFGNWGNKIKKFIEINKIPINL